jgi:hypothetical protein
MPATLVLSIHLTGHQPARLTINFNDRATHAGMKPKLPALRDVLHGVPEPTKATLFE